MSNDPLHQFVEELSLQFEASGVPPMLGRILGWLLVCDPPHQSSNQLAEALGASKASISTGTRMLAQLGLIERVPMRGKRGLYFRLKKNAWLNHVLGELDRARNVRELADRGLRLLPPERQARLHELREVYIAFEEAFPAIVERMAAHDLTRGETQ